MAGLNFLPNYGRHPAKILMGFLGLPCIRAEADIMAGFVVGSLSPNPRIRAFVLNWQALILPCRTEALFTFIH